MKTRWKWYADVEEMEYLAVASRLRLKSFWGTPTFLRFGIAIQRQLARTKGLVCYSMLMDPMKRTYGTLSIWRSERDLMQFTKEFPHSRVMEKMKSSLAGRAVYVRWAVSSAEVPPSWELAIEKLSEAEKAV
jgi:hypothetical protein